MIDGTLSAIWECENSILYNCIVSDEIRLDLSMNNLTGLFPVSTERLDELRELNLGEFLYFYFLCDL